MTPTKPYSCEKSCPCIGHCGEFSKLIVITGGPGAGKTAFLEFLRKDLCEHIAILPEAASILFNGGFLRWESELAAKAAQRAIYHVQNEIQKIVVGEKKWAIGLCDRGTLDGLAYWPGAKADYFSELNTSLEKEYEKYIAVIHLATPTIQNGYNHENPMRIESPVEAAVIDAQIHLVWKDHPNYFRIESTNDFLDKVQRTSLLVHKYLPECCRRHF